MPQWVIVPCHCVCHHFLRSVLIFLRPTLWQQACVSVKLASCISGQRTGQLQAFVSRGKQPLSLSTSFLPGSQVESYFRMTVFICCRMLRLSLLDPPLPLSRAGGLSQTLATLLWILVDFSPHHWPIQPPVESPDSLEIWTMSFRKLKGTFTLL